MRYIKSLLFFGLLLTFACSEDIGINDFSYQCKTDMDCKEGYTCDKQKGCIRIARDAGTDAISDIISTDITDTTDLVDVNDTGDVSEIMDVRDIADISDIEDISDIADIGDVSDITDFTDVIEDIPDIEDVSLEDVEDVSLEDVLDVGDGGIDTRVNYIIRLESVYDSNAGVCSSVNYTLESVTGFTASDEMKNSQFILHRSMLFKK
ncbi:MAG: hypothetical protein ACP5QK_02490 [Myxococcota bacterium]